MSGKLIADTPLAASCYPGPAQNAATCAFMDTALTNQTYVAETAIGLSYPTDSCPAVDANAGLPLKNCSIGDQPRYTVNATQVSDVVSTVKYASQKNLRLVIRNTGHDILRRYEHVEPSSSAFRMRLEMLIFQPDRPGTVVCRYGSTILGPVFSSNRLSIVRARVADGLALPFLLEVVTPGRMSIH